MNKEYIYIDGKAIVIDEKGSRTPIEYYDNLDEVLVQENLIESMEKKISKLEKENTRHKKDSKHYIPIAPALIIFSIVAGHFMASMWNLPQAAITIFGSQSPSVVLPICLIAVFTPLYLLFDFAYYRLYRENKKKKKGINSELEFLKKQLGKEKEHLESLKGEITKEKENTDFRTVIVDDERQLSALETYEDLYFDLGYNSDKYLKLYHQGRLEAKLESTYNETEIEIAKEYLEEKGPVLVKKR